jgi:hypothetical protein
LMVELIQFNHGPLQISCNGIKVGMNFQLSRMSRFSTLDLTDNNQSGRQILIEVNFSEI